MRPVGIVLAVLLIAACPPRRSRVVYVQSVPVAPVAHAATAQPVPQALPPVAVDPVLDPHLRAWEEKIASITNLRAEISLARTDAVFKKTTHFGGPSSGSVLLWMKPNYVLLRLDNTGDPTKTDYEAYICDGDALFAYNGIARTVTKIALPGRAQAREPENRFQTSNPLFERLSGLFGSALLASNPLLDLLGGMKAKEMKERFEITLLKTDENYLYLDFKPRLGKDEAAFKHLRLALYGPGLNTAKFAYLPAQVYVLKPNGDTEVWKLTNSQVDIPGVEVKHFRFIDIKGWKVQEALPWPSKPDVSDPLVP